MFVPNLKNIGLKLRPLMINIKVPNSSGKCVLGTGAKFMVPRTDTKLASACDSCVIKHFSWLLQSPTHFAHVLHKYNFILNGEVKNGSFQNAPYANISIPITLKRLRKLLTSKQRRRKFFQEFWRSSRPWFWKQHSTRRVWSNMTLGRDVPRAYLFTFVPLETILSWGWAENHVHQPY